jgi:hypothetical protein
LDTFDFFNSFFGLVLGLSVTVMATGLAAAIQHRKTIKIGWLTPLLALFLGLDIASFWASAWSAFQDLPFSYGLLTGGLAISLIYFVAASLVFPHQIVSGMSLDEHFWENKKVVLLLSVAANILMQTASIGASLSRGGNFEFSLGILFFLTIPAAFTHRQIVFFSLMGLYVAVYLTFSVISIIVSEVSDASMTHTPAVQNQAS